MAVAERERVNAARPPGYAPNEARPSRRALRTLHTPNASHGTVASNASLIGVDRPPSLLSEHSRILTDLPVLVVDLPLDAI
jgi:hypothetical protein